MDSVGGYILWFFDFGLVYFITKRNRSLRNRYFDLHRRYGVLKVTVFKLIYILFVSHFLLIPPGNAGAVGAMGILYCVVVITLIVDFVRGEQKTN